MDSSTRLTLSVVVPIYNEEEVIEVLHSRLLQVLALTVERFEIIFVNDGSRDRSASMLDSICLSDPRFKALHFSRNFGHQAAVTAGLHAVRGDCAVVIDADLQDPPELMLTMLEKWREGFEVVYAQRVAREGEGFFKRTTASLFYKILGSVSEIHVPPDTGDFCLMDRKIVDLLNSLPERNRFLRGLRAWLGFRQTAVMFERPARYAGTTKYPFTRMLALATDAVFALSKAPLRIATYLGFSVSAISFLLGVAFIIERLISDSAIARGWASTIVVVLFLGGVQLICLGVIGEFIGRIYDEVKGRPLYVVARTVTAGDRAAAVADA
ncbi:MAG TPA: glycosyltransferase family 2 protein [Gemmatimonadaceae bacterium]|nr:glycosyltransferase family 2 protein [Gemmatimonadaceae bacterium]